MSTLDFFGLLAGTMGLAMALAPLLQLRRMLLLGSAREISRGFLSVIAVGAGCYAAYGLALGSPYLVIPNTVGVITNVAVVLTATRLRHANTIMTADDVRAPGTDAARARNGIGIDD